MSNEPPSKPLSKDELLREKPCGDVLIEHDGKIYAAFICYGCQTCWVMTEDGENVEWAYPHFLKWEKQI